MHSVLADIYLQKLEFNVNRKDVLVKNVTPVYLELGNQFSAKFRFKTCKVQFVRAQHFLRSTKPASSDNCWIVLYIQHDYPYLMFHLI